MYQVITLTRLQDHPQEYGRTNWNEYVTDGDMKLKRGMEKSEKIVVVVVKYSMIKTCCIYALHSQRIHFNINNNF